MTFEPRKIKLNRILTVLTFVLCLLLLQACVAGAPDSGAIEGTPAPLESATEQPLNTASPTRTNVPATQRASQTPFPSFPTQTATSAPSQTAAILSPTPTYDPRTSIPVTGGGPGDGTLIPASGGPGDDETPTSAPSSTPESGSETSTQPVPGPSPTQTEALIERDLNPVQLLQAAEVEERVMEISWPTRMRLGNSDWIRFSFKINEPEPESGTATLEITVEAPDREELQGLAFVIPVPESHVITVDATINAIGLQISPQDSRQRLFRPGEDIEWIWIIQPENAGRHFVSFSLELIFSPIDGDNDPIKLSFDTQAVEIDVVTAFGLTGDHLKAIGYLGTISGAIGTLSQIQDQATDFLKGIVPRPKKPVKPKGEKAKEKNKLDKP